MTPDARLDVDAHGVRYACALLTKAADALLAALAPVEAAPIESKGKVAREWTNADPSRSPVVTPTTKSPEDGENQRGEENSDPPPLDPDTHPLREEALAAWTSKYVRQPIISNPPPSPFKCFLQGYIAGHADARASGRLTPTPAPEAKRPTCDRCGGSRIDPKQPNAMWPYEACHSCCVDVVVSPAPCPPPVAGSAEKDEAFKALLAYAECEEAAWGCGELEPTLVLHGKKRNEHAHEFLKRLRTKALALSRPVRP